ncbi:MAG: ATP-binding cassette domain-containing protein [Moraxellaceae bacterium]|nr:ATP-binding cassette domain-containing protein [Moraxellaceae bacterium]
MSSDELIVARGVSKTVLADSDSLQILHDVSLTIKRGESLAIVGASGSGKTTLLGLLAGLDTASAGSVQLCGHSLETLNEDDRAALRKQYVGFVFQSFLLVPALSALENVMLALSVNGRGDESVAREWLERVGLTHRLHHTPRQLSGGEQQRVALARAFAGRPAILFADEPTGNLDAVTGSQIDDLLFTLNAEAGTTLVLVTHEARLAARCQRSIRLQAGRVLEDAA